MALTTTTGSGTQTSTGTPQTVGSTPSGTNSGSVQPGTAPTLLTNNTQGVSLSNQALTTVDLNASQTTTATTSTQSQSSNNNHQANPVAIGFCALLFVFAIGLFVFTSRSAKNTT